MKDALCITLGHGASAILILNNKIINGYQLERITGIKGDSRFPGMAIEMIEKYDPIPSGIPIYISHWYPSGDIDSMSERHYNPQYLKSKFPHSIIISTNTDITHHDAHAFSALAYNDEMRVDDHIMVADGFGNCGEVLSIYTKTISGVKLLKRVFGYDLSMGLLYQYATDYVGLKQNQDEWKLNAMANQVSLREALPVRELAHKLSNEYISGQCFNQDIGPDDPVTNLGALSHTHSMVARELAMHFKPEERANIALFLQTIVEDVFSHWITAFGMTDITLVGGCFLNVQLNGFLHEFTNGRICVMPLSGDEGAALGLFKAHSPDFYIPDDLCWGKRDLNPGRRVAGIYYVEDMEESIREALNDNAIVNVVRGKMEYGPRAYGNTSTLAIPTEANREYINILNDRDMSMPMCPILTLDDFLSYFEPTDCIRSIEHMILALRYNHLAQGLDGVHHVLLDGSHTGRPQVLYYDHWLYNICDEFGPLINTSFNNHGHPICFETSDVIECHEYMRHNDYEGRLITLVQI